LAEARILVRPDTTGFRAELEAALKLATAKPIVIPVVAAVAGTSVSGAAAAVQTAAANQTKLAASSATATTSVSALSAAMKNEAVASQALNSALNGVILQGEKVTLTQTEAAAATTANVAAQTRQLGQLERGAGASALSLFGLRGATLAASGSFLAGTAAVVGFSKAIQSFASFQTELNVFRVNAGATADEMARVDAEARQLGRDLTLPGITASDAAQAMTELAKAGLSVADALAAARGTLQLATAAQIDNGAAAKLVAGALNSFQLAGTDAVKVADLFAGAAKSAQGSIEDFGPALGQASAVAHGFGISIEDTVTLLTELAKAGLQGGRAGTSLRVALLRLVKPPADAAKALKDLNVQVRDVNGNLRPQVFTDIDKALQGVSKAQRQATEATIFGSDAVRTQILLGQAGVKGFNDIKAAVTEAGLAQEQAAARTQGLQGDFENLSNQASSLGLTLGQVSSGPVHLFVSTLGETLSNVNTIADGVLVLSGNFRKLGSSISQSDPALGFVAKHLDDIGKGILLINPVTRALEIASFAMKKFGVDAETTADKTKFFGNIAKNAAKGVDDLAASLQALAAAARAQGPKDNGLGVTPIQNIVVGFDAKTVRDKIAHDNAQLVADLQAEQDFLIAQLQRQFVKNRPALKKALEQSLLGVVNDLDSIQATAAAKAKAAKDKAAQIAKDALAAATAAAQALINLQNSRLDLRIQAAGLTKGTGDDKRAINAAIKVFQDRIDGINKVKNKTVEQQQAVVDLQSKIISLREALKNLNAKSDSSSGFSLSDLFREGVQNFATFGSNIAGRNGVLSAQDARASLGANIASIAGAQLTEAQRQTALLESINSNTSPTGKTSGRTGSAARTGGSWQSFRETLVAANNGYGSF
jgi:TP901 family phage tail tape measure protein